MKKRRKSTEISKVKKELWELCKQLTRKAYGKTCYTCRKKRLKKSNCHTAHFIPSASCGTYLRYDLRNLRVCCYHCNINLGGAGALYYHNMRNEVGQDTIDQLFKDVKRKVKNPLEFYKSLVVKYKSML